MKKKAIKKSFIYYISLFILPLFILWRGVYFLQPGDEMGYCLLYYFILMPFSSLITAIVFTFKKIKPIWLHPILFGIFEIVIPYPVFGGTIDIYHALFTIIPSLIGIAIAKIIIYKKHNK